MMEQQRVARQDMPTLPFPCPTLSLFTYWIISPAISTTTARRNRTMLLTTTITTMDNNVHNTWRENPKQKTMRILFAPTTARIINWVYLPMTIGALNKQQTEVVFHWETFLFWIFPSSVRVDLLSTTNVWVVQALMYVQCCQSLSNTKRSGTSCNITFAWGCTSISCYYGSSSNKSNQDSTAAVGGCQRVLSSSASLRNPIVLPSQWPRTAMLVSWLLALLAIVKATIGYVVWWRRRKLRQEAVERKESCSSGSLCTDQECEEKEQRRRWNGRSHLHCLLVVSFLESVVLLVGGSEH